MTTLYELLKAKDITPRDFARRIGVDKGTLSRWNGGQVPVPDYRMTAIEEVSGVPMRTLLLNLRPDLLEIARRAYQ